MSTSETDSKSPETLLGIAFQSSILSSRLDGYVLSKHGISSTPWLLMSMIAEAESKSVRPMVVAKRLGISRQAISQAYKRLGEDGLVEIETAENKNVTLRLTPEGEQKLADVTAEMAQYSEEFLEKRGNINLAWVGGTLRALQRTIPEEAAAEA
ncbi:MAG: MarR family transcriptional regulator [Pseudomonadota bacterium]